MRALNGTSRIIGRGGRYVRHRQTRKCIVDAKVPSIWHAISQFEFEIEMLTLLQGDMNDLQVPVHVI